MTGPIQHRELWKRLNNIGQKDWIKLAERNGLFVATGNPGSHYVNIRDPKMPDRQDPRGLISTVTPNCYKQANEQIFKRFLERSGLTEEEIWKGLRLM